MDEILSYMNNGVLNLKSLKEVNLSRQSIYNFIKRNNMEKVGPGIYISKEKSKDMMWPDMDWIYILGYDLWNFAYTYNCISSHSVYCGVILLLSCTIPAFFIKKGCWLQHRAHTLALWIMFIMTVPQFADRLAPVPTTHNPTAFFIVSLLALVVNAAAVIYQFSVIRRNKLNPFRDELYTEKAFYKKIRSASRKVHNTA